MARVLREETPLEYFRERVVAAMEREKVQASAFTEYYLVELLARWAQGRATATESPEADAMPLSMLYLRALSAASHERARLLRARFRNSGRWIWHVRCEDIHWVPEESGSPPFHDVCSISDLRQ